MCLTLRLENSDKPYNEHFTRYKMVAVKMRDSKGRFLGTPQYFAAYRGIKYNRSSWNRARLNNQPKEEGFHVLLTAKDARKFINDKDKKVKTVAVRGFLRSGIFGGSDCETWKEMIFLD